MVVKAYKNIRNNMAENNLNNKWFYKDHEGKEFLSFLIHNHFPTYRKAKKKEKRAAYREIGVRIGRNISKGLETMMFRFAA